MSYEKEFHDVTNQVWKANTPRQAQSAVQPLVSRSPVSVEQMVAAFLRANGYDGLYQDDECACEVGDLFPCGTANHDCCAGYKVACDCGNHDFHISSSRG